MSVGIVLLIDESSAMDSSAVTTAAGPASAANLGAAPKSKAESVATAVNSLLAKIAQAGDCEVALVGYRSTRDGATEVGLRWGGALSGREFVPAAEVSSAPVTVETRMRRLRNELGLIDETPVPFPIWYQPSLGDKAPQIAAFDFCRDLLSRWTPSTGHQGQPLVIHLFSGSAGDGNPLKAVKAVQESSVGGSAPLVLHIHLSSSGTTLPVLFPANRAYLSVGPQRELFERSSLLPPHLADALKANGVTVNQNARAMIYNAKMVDVTRALAIVTPHVQKSLAGQATVAAAATPTARPADGGPKLGPAIIKAPPAIPGRGVAKPAPAAKPPTAVAPPAAPKLVKPPVAPPAAAAIVSEPAAPAPVPVAPIEPAPIVPDAAPLDLAPTEDLLLSPETVDLLVGVDDGAATLTAGAATGVSPGSPACLVFLLDRSVEDPFSADLGNACAKLQTQLSDFVAEVAKGGKGAVDVAVVTYGDSGGDTEVRSTLEGGLAGRTFARDNELLAGAVRVDEFEDQVSDGVGGLITIPRKRPVLVEVDPTSAARPQPAFQAVASILRTWCSEHPAAALSPIVLHLTRGQTDAAELLAGAGELAGVSTAGGAPVTLYHCVSTEQPHPSVVFPNSDADLSTASLQALWQASSGLLFGDALSAEKPSLKSGARGMVVNGKFFLLLDPVKRSLATDA